MSWKQFRETPKHRARRLALDEGRVSFEPGEDGRWRSTEPISEEPEVESLPGRPVEFDDPEAAARHHAEIDAIRTWRRPFPSMVATGEVWAIVLVLGAGTARLTAAAGY